MGRIRSLSVAAVITISAFALVSCSKSSTGPSKGNAALIGTYDLASLTFQGQPTLTPPLATGSMTLADTTYNVSISINVPGQPAQNIQDAGTYSVSGTAWTQTSATEDVQSIGTYKLSNDTLSVSVSTSGQEQSSVWVKQ